VIRVDARARTRPDRAGEPLDGLVNMFDIGIVLAVGFLIAALEALNLSPLLTKKTTISSTSHTLVVKPNQKIVTVTPGSKRVIVKSASSVGQVYQLPNGQYVLVRKR
jgi:hypothetical protein